MMIARSSAASAAYAFSLCAYSIAALVSWMEHGPTMTNRIVATFDDLLRSLSSGNNGLGSSKGQRQVLHQDLRRNQRVDRLDTLVIELVEGILVADLCGVF